MPVRRAGTYTVSLGATAINGRRSVRSVTFVVLKPKPKPQAEARGKAEARREGQARREAIGAAKRSAPAKKDQGSAKRTKPGS